MRAYSEIIHTSSNFYTSFPEGQIRIHELEIGGYGERELEEKLKENNINVFEYALDMMRSPGFKTLEKPENIKTVRLKVRDLGLPSGGTTEQVFAHGQALGLDLCPPEAGVYQRLKDMDQPLNDWYRIAMKPISARPGYPRVFDLVRDDNGLWLDYCWPEPVREWCPESVFMFSLRKSLES